jgi:hypothetical protein
MASWSARAPRSIKQHAGTTPVSSVQMKNKSGDGAHLQDYMKTVSNLTNTQKALVSQMGLQPYTSALMSFSFILGSRLGYSPGSIT